MNTSGHSVRTSVHHLGDSGDSRTDENGMGSPGIYRQSWLTSASSLALFLTFDDTLHDITDSSSGCFHPRLLNLRLQFPALLATLDRRTLTELLHVNLKFSPRNRSSIHLPSNE